MDDLQPGDVLIASPYLHDPNFRRTVVILCDHSGEGSLGLVVNRPLPINLGSVLAPMADTPAGEAPLFQGGPVDPGRLLAVSRNAPPEEPQEPVGPGLVLLTDLEDSLERVEEGQVSSDDVRFFLGYAGWGGGQLKSEVDQGAWIVSEKSASANLTFETPTRTMWSEILRSLGGQYAWLADMPLDPDLN